MLILKHPTIVLLLCLAAAVGSWAADGGQEELPDDTLPFTLHQSGSGSGWEGRCEYLEGFGITLDVSVSGEWNRDSLFAAIRGGNVTGTLTYPNGKTTEIRYEIVRHRGPEAIYMKTSLGHFLWERLSVTQNTIAFTIYWWYHPPATERDVEILDEARSLLAPPGRWHREDDRKCDADEAEDRWSLYCALKQASVSLSGEYNHHNTAMQTVRFAIEEAAPGHEYEHALMDFNNAPATNHEDILQVLDLAKKRIRRELSEARIGEVLDRSLHTWDDEELSIEELTIDLDQKKRRTVTAAQAAEDVERLFELFAHGYAGYGYFSKGDCWQEAKEKILADLESQAEWRVADLPGLFRKRLPFVHDCHLKIGSQRFAGHRDFWYDDGLEIRKRDGAYECHRKRNILTLIRVNGEDPAASLVPSLNRKGEKVLRIGLLSDEAPEPAVVEARSGSREVRFEVPLHRSTFRHFSRKMFRKDLIGGIPVLRVRSFSDGYEAKLQEWIESADGVKDAPCVVVDVRGNHGGNERWPIEWIRRLTGETADSVFVYSELHSRTTLAGRANGFDLWLSNTPDSEFMRREADAHRERLNRYGPGGEKPAWTEIRFPEKTTIPCDTIVVVVTNGLVASAGEGFVMRVSRLENVVVVGENTRGALTFGNVSLHRLPRSGLDVWMPINVNLFPDGVFREEEGLVPDYWVPAADAVNCAVAALRNGTIPTVRPLPAEWRGKDFAGEDALHLKRRALFVLLFAVVGCLWAFLARRKGGRLMIPGILWMIIGPFWIVFGAIRGKPFLSDLGYGFTALGFVLAAAGMVLWILSRVKAEEAARSQMEQP